MDKLDYWPDEEDPADIGTKGKATVEDVSETGDWQPSPEESRSVPDEELRVKEFFTKDYQRLPKITKDYQRLPKITKDEKDPANIVTESKATVEDVSETGD